MNDNHPLFRAEHEIFPVLFIEDVLSGEQIKALCEHAQTTKTKPSVVLREIVNGWMGVR